MTNKSSQAELLAFLNDELEGDSLTFFFDRLRKNPALARQLLDAATDEELLREWANNSVPEARQMLPMPAIAAPQASPWYMRSATILMVLLLLVATVGWVTWQNLPTSVAEVKSASGEAKTYQNWWNRTIRKSDMLSFASGLVELRTASGVKLVIEGPSECRFDSAQRLLLTSGRVFAEVPKSGIGFQIQTPDGEIVDLGTQFGVDVQVGKVTEVYVFAGSVAAKLSGKEMEAEPPTAMVKAGSAVALDAKSRNVADVPMKYDFAQHAGAWVEDFSYEQDESLDGKNGWFASKPPGDAIRVNARKNIEYAGMSSQPGLLELGSSNSKQWSPLGRRWHDRYLSMLIIPDDDFPKRLGMDPATLLSFGDNWEGPTTEDLRLVVRRSNPHNRQSAEFGLKLGDAEVYLEQANFSAQAPCLIVIRRREDRMDLWVNPDQSSFGKSNSPPPDLTLKADSQLNPNSDVLWLGATSYPSFTWYYVDDVRGGNDWSAVVPAGR